MVAHNSWLDPDHVTRLQRAFRISMRRLLVSLCDELDGPYRMETRAWRLPVAFFRSLGEQLDVRAFDGSRVVGWLECLNDLVYFVDLLRQFRRERDLIVFSEALFEECEEQFYEHGYRDDLFPHGRPQTSGIGMRIRRLCQRLIRQVIQESLFLQPGLLCRWVAIEGRDFWNVPVDLGPDFERGEQPGNLGVGTAGTCIRLPKSVLKQLAGLRWQATLKIRKTDIRIGIGGKDHLIGMCRGERFEWRMPLADSLPLRLVGNDSLTLGPTLIYGRTRVPKRVAPSSASLAGQVQDALMTIEQVWPDGAALLASLTSRIIPLRADGVVSFSYRHRPGLSFINVFDRDRLDLIDDLIHENSHHHLNLLLRKHVLYRGDRNQEIFYSPWRRSLRPLRGILHATFTFTMGAILFERLSSWATRVGEAEIRKTGLSRQDVLRARYRCLEELDSVRYSLRDLDHAATDLRWITASGASLVDSLRREVARVEKRIRPFQASVLRSRYGSELTRHRRELAAARKTYGPR